MSVATPSASLHHISVQEPHRARGRPRGARCAAACAMSHPGGWGELAQDEAPQPELSSWAALAGEDEGAAQRLAACGWGALARADGGSRAAPDTTPAQPPTHLPSSLPAALPPQPCANASARAVHSQGSGVLAKRRGLADPCGMQGAKRGRCDEEGVVVGRRPPSLPPRTLATAATGKTPPFVASPLLAHLVACADVAGAFAPDALDGLVQEVASVFVHGLAAFHGASDSSLGERFGVDRRRVSLLFARLASASTLMDRAHRSEVEKACSSIAGCELLEYIDGSRYDETPLGMRARQEMRKAFEAVAAEEGTNSAPTGAPSQPSLAGVRPLLQGSSDGPIKVMQTESTYTMLLKLTGDHKACCVMLRGVTGNWLQSADRMTADVIRALLQGTSACSLGALQFRGRSRVVCTDKFSGNKKAERAIARDRGDSWKLLHVDCRVHINATIHSSAFDWGTDGEHISDMFHLSLSLRVQGQLAKFRELLRAWIVDHVVLLRGAPPPDAVACKERAIRVFFGESRQIVPKVALLRSFANGDWRNTSAVEHYTDVAADDTEALVLLKARVADAIVEALASSQPYVYPRHRWEGAERSIEELARLEVTHGLLHRGYGLYVAHLREQRGGATRSGPPFLRTIGSAEALADDPDELAESLTEVAYETLLDASGPQEECGGDQTWQQENTKHRRLGLRFASRKPLPFLVYMRLAMEPLRAHRAALRFLGSDAWERQQLLAEAKAARTLEGQPKIRRSYRVVICAEGTLEANFFHKLDTLFCCPELFGLIPEARVTESMSAHIFVLLSRMGALMEYLLSHPSRGYPWKLFKMMKQRSLATEIAADAAERPCLLDPFSASFVAENDLASEDAYYRLVALASHTQVDIAPIESLHAVVRRHVFQKSVHTHAPTLERISSDFVAHCHRQRSRMVAPGVADPQYEIKGESTEDAPEKAKPYLPARTALSWRLARLVTTRGDSCRAQGSRTGLSTALMRRQSKRWPSLLAELSRPGR